MNFAGLRLKAMIASRGDDYLIAAATRRGLFSVLTFGQAATFVPLAVLDVAAKPYYQLIVAHDDPLAVADTLDWQGRTFEVLHVNEVSYMNEVAGRVALIA